MWLLPILFTASFKFPGHHYLPTALSNVPRRCLKQELLGITTVPWRPRVALSVSWDRYFL